MEARVWTKPLRELTPETSLGFEVIEFAEKVLNFHFLPWQEWLLIHALELKEDGTYRFQKLVILVGRQNGKTTLLTILSLWWLYVDSLRFPDRVDPSEFLILGTAQDLDTAIEAWERTNRFCDPDPENEQGVPALQARTLKPRRVNGGTAIRLKSGQLYRAKAANRKGGRGKSAARVLMDELREQQNFDAWSSVSKTKNAIYNSQIWTISNAGDAKSVVLMHLRDQCLLAVEDYDELVLSGEMTMAEWEASHDTSMGLFEWSAPEDCELDDYQAIAHANPALGYSMPWETIMSDMKGDPEFVFRTEVLCQWVTAAVFTYILPTEWEGAKDENSRMDADYPISLAVHTSADRSKSYVAVAGTRKDGANHVEVIAQRPGMLWVPKLVETVCEKYGIQTVRIQQKGTPAIELIEPIKELGLDVDEIGGSDLGSSTGQFRDKVRDRTVFHRGQPTLDLAVAGGTTKRLGDMQFWDMHGSMVDIAPLVAVTYALFGLGRRQEPKKVSAYMVEGDNNVEQEDWWK